METSSGRLGERRGERTVKPIDLWHRDLWHGDVQRQTHRRRIDLDPRQHATLARPKRPKRVVCDCRWNQLWWVHARTDTHPGPTESQEWQNESIIKNVQMETHFSFSSSVFYSPFACCLCPCYMRMEKAKAKVCKCEMFVVDTWSHDSHSTVVK